MNRPSAAQAALVGGSSIAAAAIAVGVGQIELSGQPQPRIWSNVWLLIALGLAGTGLLIAVALFVMSMFSREYGLDAPAGPGSAEPGVEAIPGLDPTASETADQARVASALRQLSLSRMRNRLATSAAIDAERSEAPLRSEPAVIGSWRHTADGFEASPLMNMANLSMPGFESVRGESPQFRVGVCVASDPIASDVSSSFLGAKLLEFLRCPLASDLITSVVSDAAGMIWTRHAGNGALSLEAVLALPGDNRRPAASALFQPPVIGLRLYGRSEGIACIWIHLDPSDRNGGGVAAAGLGAWFERFVLAIRLAGAFANFLTDSLGLHTYDVPAARAGVMIQTVGPIVELVDPGDLAPLPGSFPAGQFLGYAIADTQGKSATHVARELLTQLCDHTLHLGDFEPVLESIVVQDKASSQGTRASSAVPNTWDNRDLPVLTAVIKLLERPSVFAATVSQISEATGIDKYEVDRALDAMTGEYIEKYQKFLSGGDTSTWYVQGITPKGRRVTGQWPNL